MIYKDKRFDELVRTKWDEIVRSRRFPEVADSWIATYTPSPKSPRMIAQQSLFTMAAPKADHGRMIDQRLEDGLYSKCRIYVSPEVKKRLRRRILQMNMTAAALFPGIEGIGQTIREGLEMTERGLAT